MNQHVQYILEAVTDNISSTLDVTDPSQPIRTGPPPRSIVVRASPQGAGGRGLIPDRVTPKTLKMGGLRFSACRLALMS